jgi:hypothetical protein
MKSLLITDTETKDMVSEATLGPKQPERYPYGMCLHVDAQTMKKLEMEALPPVGAKFMILAMAEVKEARMDGEDKSFALQIKEIDMKAKKKDGIDLAEDIYK